MEPVTLTQFLIICPFIFLAGIVDAIAGGGGLISLPAYIIAGMPAHISLGTNKFSSCLGTSIATYRLARNGFIPLRLGLICAAAAIAGSNIGAHIALMVDGSVIEKVMTYSLPVIAFYVLRNKKLGQNDELELAPTARQGRITAALALIIGIYDGFYGPGTGTFMLLAFSSVAGLGLRTSSGLTKAANLGSNFGALCVFILNDKVYFPLAFAGAVCNILGNYIGAGLVLHNAAKYVRPVMIVVLALLFCKLAFGL